MSNTLINNVAYSWAMIELKGSGNAAITDTVLDGCTAISWNRKRNVSANYGLSGKLRNRGFGNLECEASITLDYNAQTAIRGSKKSLLQVGEFDLIITWAKEMGENLAPGIANTESTTLQGCFFNEDGMSVKQDDTKITKEFNLNLYDILEA